jgi:hypothetical protein
VESDTECDAATIRANHPIPPQCKLFYFEVDIVDKGKTGYVRLFIYSMLLKFTYNCFDFIFQREIGVGFCTKSFDLNRFPGNCHFYCY